MTHASAPSLFEHQAARDTFSEQCKPAGDLVDLMYDGFYLMFMIRNRHPPGEAGAFRSGIREFLEEFDRQADRLGVEKEDVDAAKYAFCASIDELILSSRFSIRDAWERNPLQLAFFGDQLAGERFYEKLEGLRAQGAPRLQSLEIFHLCLLMGFRGRYLLDGSDNIGYLIGRLGDEIAHYKGKRATFSPSWSAPDQVRNLIRPELPLWSVLSAYALVGLIAFASLQWLLERDVRDSVSKYHNLIRVAPPQAHLTVSLP